MTIFKFVAAIVGLLGGAAITVKLVFGVWIPKGTPMWLVFWVPIVGVLLVILMSPAALKSLDESFDRGTELYEKVSDKWRGVTRPTPYVTVCTPEGGWRSVSEALKSLEDAGITVSPEAREFLAHQGVSITPVKRCYELFRVPNGRDFLVYLPPFQHLEPYFVCKSEALFAFALHSKRNVIAGRLVVGFQPNHNRPNVMSVAVFSPELKMSGYRIYRDMNRLTYDYSEAHASLDDFLACRLLK